MAVTTPTTIDTSIPEVWASEVLRDHRYKGFWGRFVGSAIVQKSELLNKPGDLIHIQTGSYLTAEGVTGDTATLEGNEEALSLSEIKVSPLLYRHAVRINRRANKKSIVELRAEAKMRLAEWGANKMDAVRFEKFSATTLPAPLASETYNAPNYFVAGGTDGSPSVDDITAGETLTVARIQQLRLLLEAQRATPINQDGFPFYALVIHPNALYALKREEEYRDWVREAHIRGADNPFFKGATAILDGIVIYSHFNSLTVTNSGPLLVAKGLAFGAEAFVEGLDELKWQIPLPTRRTPWPRPGGLVVSSPRAAPGSSAG
jgi:N4-gp56 family major capsid protein